MRVLLVTSRDPYCGISCHSDLLIDAVTKADPTIEFTASADALDPYTKTELPDTPDLLHLNYQAALHSRWTQLVIRAWRQEKKIPVLVTYHDTGVPNSDQCKAIVHACDAAVVHEPFDDLPPEKTHYWRQGVPEYDGVRYLSPHEQSGPVIGTAGHDFPWKNFDLLCDLAEAAGWGVVICSPRMTAERQAALRAKCRRLTIWTELSHDMAIAALRGCDATAWLYVTNNTGTSGAIRMGIAAKKPMLAFATCRQFRDVVEDMDLGIKAIRWCQTVEDVKVCLETLPLTRFDPLVAKLAERDSWTHLGRKYAELYQRIGGVQ